jgi:selenide,water dikinase
VPDNAMQACIEALTTLNRNAAQAMQGFEIHAATDVTGFGLAGHTMEMAKASKTTIEIDIERLPIMDQALEMYRRGMTTGVNKANRQLVADSISIKSALPPWHQEIVFDPQTSGGLLCALPQDQATELVAKLQALGTPAAHIIGQVKPLNETCHLIFK